MFFFRFVLIFFFFFYESSEFRNFRRCIQHPSIPADWNIFFSFVSLPYFPSLPPFSAFLFSSLTFSSLSFSVDLSWIITSSHFHFLSFFRARISLSLYLSISLYPSFCLSLLPSLSISPSLRLYIRPSVSLSLPQLLSLSLLFSLSLPQILSLSADSWRVTIVTSDNAGSLHIECRYVIT